MTLINWVLSGEALKGVSFNDYQKQSNHTQVKFTSDEILNKVENILNGVEWRKNNADI